MLPLKIEFCTLSCYFENQHRYVLEITNEYDDLTNRAPFIDDENDDNIIIHIRLILSISRGVLLLSLIGLPLWSIRKALVSQQLKNG